MDVKLDFAEAMRLDMERLGMSEAAVGKAMGISQQAVHKWVERGFPPLSRVARLREVLGANGAVAKLTHEELFGNGKASRTPRPIDTSMFFAGDAPPMPNIYAQLAESREGLTWVQMFARTQEAQFRAAIPEALKCNLEREFPVATTSRAMRADYASDKLVAEVLYAAGNALHSNSSAALLRLMVYRAAADPKMRAALIFVCDHSLSTVTIPQQVLLGAQQFGIELKHAQNGEQAAQFIADVEAGVPAVAVEPTDE